MTSEKNEYQALKTAFLAIISHELRTPLTEILAASDALGGTWLGQLNQTQREYLEMIQDAARRLNTLVDDLISFSQLQAQGATLVREPARLSAIIDLVVGNYRTQASKRRIALHAFLATDLLPISVDQAKISRVVSNLLANALNYTPAGGSVTVSQRAVPGYQCIDVQDTGPGIAPERQALLFESFYQAGSHLTRQVGGLGLGLAYARQIVEAHQGKLTLLSEPNQGSLFTVWLPDSVG